MDPRLLHFILFIGGGDCSQVGYLFSNAKIDFFTSVIIAFTIETFEEQHDLLGKRGEAEDDALLGTVFNEEIRERVQLALQRNDSYKDTKAIRIRARYNLGFLVEEQYKEELRSILRQSVLLETNNDQNKNPTI